MIGSHVDRTGIYIYIYIVPVHGLVEFYSRKLEVLPIAVSSSLTLATN